jgi:hypothetical protein
VHALLGTLCRAVFAADIPRVSQSTEFSGKAPEIQFSKIGFCAVRYARDLDVTNVWEGRSKIENNIAVQDLLVVEVKL